MAGRALLSILAAGTLPVPVLNVLSPPPTADRVAGMLPALFTLLAVLASALLVWAWFAWPAGRSGLPLSAAWLAVPVWMGYFGAVLVAIACAGALSLLAWLRRRHAASLQATSL